jgi:hypothetical protein
MKKTLIGVSLASSLLLSGCLGQNALFDRVQDWNATATEEKFVNQGISFVFWWLPVYGLTLLGDVIIFNSVEFWTGENPISGEPAKVTGTTERLEDGLGGYADVTYNADGSVSVVAYANGEVERYQLQRQGNEVVKVQGESERVLGALSF